MIGARPLAAGRPANPPDGFRRLTLATAVVTPLVLALIVLLLAIDAWPSIVRSGPRFLSGRDWNPVKLEFGALPFMYGTVVSSLLALALALPVGVGVAVFLAEAGAERIKAPIGAAVELLAAIPSVVYGLWALYIMAPWFLIHVEVPVAAGLGFIPIFAPPPRPTSMMSGALVLAVMILPTLASISRDVIRAVPRGLREASYALGATWWETTWQVVLPAARGGIFGATVLALGRALGETIAITMVIGNTPQINASLFSPAYTLASVIANEFTEATGKLYSGALVELGLVLVLITLVLNLLALILVRRSTARS